MKRALALVAGAALLALGVWSAVALGAGNDEREASTVASTTATTTFGETRDTTTDETRDTTSDEKTTTGEPTGRGTGENTDTTTGEAAGTRPAAAAKAWVCHHTGSWKHPYRLIHISTHALDAHLRNLDVLPGVSNTCPTTSEAKTHGHGRGHRARPPGHGNDRNEATEPGDD